MITCPKCNQELEDGARFCGFCGAAVADTAPTEPVTEPVIAPVAEAVEEAAPVAAPVTKVTPVLKRIGDSLKSIPKNYIKLGAVSLAAVLTVVLIISLLCSGSSTAPFGLYLMDGEICYTDFSKAEPLEVTNRLLGDMDVEDYELSYIGYSLGFNIAITDDGNRLFFPDKMDRSTKGIALYYRDVNKPSQEASKVDSDITSYAINGNGTKVVYLKGEDGILYRSDLENKDKLASDVTRYYVTDDLKKVVYRNTEGVLYFLNAKNERTKIASEIDDLVYVTEDLSAVYYTLDDSLYKWTARDDDKVKIASEIGEVVKVYDSGKVYYVKSETNTISLMDYVDDDMLDADKKITEPEFPTYPDAPEYPSWRDYETDEAYAAAVEQYELDSAEYDAECARLYEEYEQAYNKYAEKLRREEMRNELENMTANSTTYSLYYYDGKESILLSDALTSDFNMTYAYDTPVIVYEFRNDGAIEKVKLSEVSYAYEISEMVDAAMDASSQWNIAIGTAISTIEEEDAAGFCISGDGRTVFFLDNISTKRNEGDLFKFTVSGKKISKIKEYDTDVHTAYLTFLENGDFSYYKKVNDEKDDGDLYINGKEIDYDVNLGTVFSFGNAYVYRTDYNDEKQTSTLMIHRRGKSNELASDVYDYLQAGENELLCLCDYSLKRYRGTLFLYRNGKLTEIADDVISLIPIYSY